MARPTTISPTMLCREAERLRWELSGRNGGLQETRFAHHAMLMDDEGVLIAVEEEGKPFVKIVGIDLLRSLDYISEKYIEQFVRGLPSVKASAHARADAERQKGIDEYASWLVVTPGPTASQCGAIEYDSWALLSMLANRFIDNALLAAGPR